MAEIFVSYRRDDTGMVCERVTSRLIARFGERRVFRDTTSIYVGSSWEQILHAALQDCYVVIALIGTDWLGARDAQGRQRLLDPHDFVRMELAAALAQGKRIIPVLANGAHMPLASELPPDLAPLATLPSLALRPDPYFESDMRAIIEVAAPGVRKRIAHPAIALCGLVGLLGVMPLTFAGLAHSNPSDFVGNAQFALYIVGLLTLALGCILILLRSIETRAWLWLTFAALLSILVPASMVGLIWQSTVALPTTVRFLVGFSVLVSQVGAVTLTCMFGFFGPRRLSRLKKRHLMQMSQRWLRAMRWAVGGCAALTSILIASMMLSDAGSIDISDGLYFNLIFISVAVALMGTTLALVSSLRQSRKRWAASLVVSAAVILGGLWIYFYDSAMPDIAASDIFYICLSCVICALDLFALRSDQKHMRAQVEQGVHAIQTAP